MNIIKLETEIVRKRSYKNNSKYFENCMVYEKFKYKHSVKIS